MAQTDRIDKMLKQTVAMGIENQALLPSLRSWCQYLQIEDHSAGMVAQMYQLPITLRISCPHSHGIYEGMNLEWNAKDFILENCTECQFHTEIFPKNFGREVLVKDRQAKQEADNLSREKASHRQALQDAIDNLVQKEQSHATITSLSILNLVLGLQITTEGDGLAGNHSGSQ